MKSLQTAISSLQDESKRIFYHQVEKPLDQQILDFEKAVGHQLGTTNVLALNSGTSALHIALSLLEVQAGDAVICSNLTFVASANPILYIGAKPILVDCDHSWNIDPNLLRAAIIKSLAKNIKPKAIIVVHLYGMPADMASIKAISKEFDIPIVEDAAHALGASYQGLPLGTAGEFGVISFNNNKIVTALGGGVLICRRREDVDRGRYLATQAKDNKPYYHHRAIGYNYRISSLNASMGVAQLPKLSSLIKKASKNFENFYQALAEQENLTWQQTPAGASPNRWRWGLVFDKLHYEQVDSIRKALLTFNYAVYRMMYPLDSMPIFQNCSKELNGYGQMLFHKGLVFPGFLNSEQLQGILKYLKSKLQRN